jgi:hypothetical protein
MNGLRARVDYVLKHNIVINKSFKFLASTGVKAMGLFTPIDEKSVIFSAHSRKYNDSPRAIYEYMITQPDITDAEIEEVIKAMKSGWITTGPRTKEFERRIAEFVGVNKAACLNSATAAMELTLRILGIGPGDEVITSAYTYTASASIIDHVGAKIVLVDTAPNSFEMIPLQKAPFECPYCRSTSGHGGENQSKIESEQGLKPTYWVHQ